MSDALLGLTDRWWDWRIDSWDGWSLRLIADNDLTYHYFPPADCGGAGTGASGSRRRHGGTHRVRIPFIKWGHLLRFDPVELQEWLDDYRHGPRRGA